VTSNVKTVSADIHCKSILGKINTVSGDIYR
ncbi:heme utilization protein, partial [Mannheimia haemolytica]